MYKMTDMSHITHESFAHSPVFIVKYEKSFQSFHISHLGNTVRSGSLISTLSQGKNFLEG